MQTAVIILAAGASKRMNSAHSKVLHPVGGRALLSHVLDAAHALDPARICVVVGPEGAAVGDAARAASPKASVAVQAAPRGTGDAVAAALPALEGFDGAVLVLFADTPLLRAETAHALADALGGAVAAALLGFRPRDKRQYGRIIANAAGEADRIVEAKDATPEDLAVDLCNGGVMAVEAETLRRLLPRVEAKNAAGEYYLTDLVGLVRGEGGRCAVVETDEIETLGVNARTELAAAEAAFQARRRTEILQAGVTLIDPSSVYFSWDTQIARDVVVEPNVWFGPGVSIGEGARIKAFSHIEGAAVAAGAAIGPFARLRPGANIGDGAKIGNFVEVKAADIGPGAKVSHLSYIGDAEIGAEANIGAGVITCNYDGVRKYKTVIGAGAFVGSNSALVAPVEIGAGAFVGSGSVVTKTVEPDALALARGRQVEKAGWAKAFRERMKSDKR